MVPTVLAKKHWFLIFFQNKPLLLDFILCLLAGNPDGADDGNQNEQCKQAQQAGHHDPGAAGEHAAHIGVDDGGGSLTDTGGDEEGQELDGGQTGKIADCIKGHEGQQTADQNGFAAVLDVVGLNYRTFRYLEGYENLPQGVVLGSETASTVSSRGVYKLPVGLRPNALYDDNQCSSYDVEYCSWSNVPDIDFALADDYEWTMGQFVWTGFDYLGEPTPYYTDWPSHSSLFGIIDLAGLPKDRYYLYRSHWNKNEETLHILPHWNWEGREGEVTPVFVYTNYPSAELFINGKSQGRRTKDLSVTVHNSADSLSIATFKRQQRYRLMWMDTVYEPGTVKVVAYDADGNIAAQKEIHTAGKPYSIELEADRTAIKADGKDLSFITVKVVDKDGNLCPTAANEIIFKVKGAGSYCAGANGDPVSLESFQEPHMKVFSGMMTAIVSSSEEPGEIVLEASSKGLKKGVIVINTQR